MMLASHRTHPQLGASRGRACARSLAPVRALDASTAAPAVTSPPTVSTPLPWDIGSSCSQGLRDGMEDDMVLAFEPKLNKLFCGVFDGHGGPAAALWLSREMQAIVTKAVEAEAKGNPTSATPPPELERALAAAFPAADEALMSHLETLGSDVLSNAGGRMHGRSCPGPVPTLCRAAAGKVSAPRASLPASRKDPLPFMLALALRSSAPSSPAAD